MIGSPYLRSHESEVHDKSWKKNERSTPRVRKAHNIGVLKHDLKHVEAPLLLTQLESNEQ